MTQISQMTMRLYNLFSREHVTMNSSKELHKSRMLTHSTTYMDILQNIIGNDVDEFVKTMRAKMQGPIFYKDQDRSSHGFGHVIAMLLAML